MQHSAQVDVDHRPPTSDIEIRHRSDLADSGVAHQDIQLTELVDGRSDEPLEVRRARDIGWTGGDRSPAAANVTCDAVEALGATRAEDHAGAALGEQTRGRLADPAARAGDHYDFALDVVHPRPFIRQTR